MNALMNKLGTRQATVAVDFGADAVRVAAVGRASDGSWVVQHAFTLPAVDLAQGMPASIMQALTARVRAAGLRGCRARVTISAAAFQSDTASLPALEEGELAASARFEAIGRMGVDETDTVIRHLTLGGTGDSRQVLLLTLPMLTARHAAEAMVASGLRPETIEHSALAAVVETCGHQSELASGITAFVQVEPRSATVMLHRAGRVSFLRALRGEWTAAAATPVVEATVHEGDIPLDPVDADAGWRWSSLAEETLRCLRQACGENAWPDRLVLGGAAAGDRSLVDALRGVCGVPVIAAPCAAWVRSSIALDAGWAGCLAAATHDRARIGVDGALTAATVEFLPATVRRDAVARLSRRRTGLLAALMIAVSMLAGVHSWNRARTAQADLDLETRMFQQASNIDELWNRLVAQHQSLKRGMEVTEGLVPPIQAANVVASVSRSLPDRVTICGLRIEREENPRRLQVLLKGFGESGSELARFQQQLAENPIFQSVVIAERRTSEVAGRRGEEFSMTMQVPLEVVIEPMTGLLKVAMGGSR